MTPGEANALMEKGAAEGSLTPSMKAYLESQGGVAPVTMGAGVPPITMGAGVAPVEMAGNPEIAPIVMPAAGGPTASGTFDAGAAGLAVPASGFAYGDDGPAPGVLPDAPPESMGPSGMPVPKTPWQAPPGTTPVTGTPAAGSGGYSDATKAWLADPKNAGTLAAVTGKNGPLVAPGPKPPAMGGGSVPTKPWDPFTKSEHKYNDDQIAYLKKQGATDEQIAEAVATGSVKQAMLMQNATAEAEAMQAQVAEREAERQAYVNQALDTQAQEAEALAKIEIDPEHFFSEKGTGSRLLMGLAVFLGGLKGGNNDALDLMQSQINRDIDAQKANLQGKYAAFNAKKGIYASRLEAFKDERMAEASTDASYWQWIGQKAQANAMMTDSEIAKAGYLKAADAAAYKVTEATDRLGLIADQRITARQQAIAAAQASANAQNDKDRQKMFDLRAKVVEERAKNGEGYPALDADKMPVLVDKNGAIVWQGAKPGGGPTTVQVYTGTNAAGDPMYSAVTAPDAKSAGDMKTAGETYASLKSNIAKLRALREKHGGGAVWSPDDQSEADSIATDIKLQMGVGYKLGALADKDLAMLDKLVPADPLEVKAAGMVGMDPVGKKLDALEAQLDQKYKIAAVGAGLPVPKPLDLQKPPP